MLVTLGQPTIECSYVESTVTDAPYFATKVKLSTEGECALVYLYLGLRCS